MRKYLMNRVNLLHETRLTITKDQTIDGVIKDKAVRRLNKEISALVCKINECRDKAVAIEKRRIIDEVTHEEEVYNSVKNECYDRVQIDDGESN